MNTNKQINVVNLKRKKYIAILRLNSYWDTLYKF